MKYTALNQTHKNAGAKMLSYAGYEMPIQYAGVTQEHMAVRERVGVFDVSHMGQFKFTGEKAQELLQKLTSNDVTKLVKNKAQYTCLINEEGGIIDDLILYMINDNDYLAVVNAGCLDKDWAWVNQQNDLGVTIDNISDETTVLAVQGPKATEVMQSLTEIDLSAIKFYNIEIGEFAGVKDVIVSATGYTGSGGFELYFDAKHSEKVWNALFEAGKKFDIEPCGLASRDTLRLEKGYCLYGNDINETTTPLEAGLGWVTKLNTDFIGADVLRKQKEDGLKRKLIAFKIVDKGIPRKDYIINDEDGNEIGLVTSGTQSPILKEGIGMGYVTIENTKVGTPIYIQIRKKSIKAEVVKTPFV